MTIRLSDLGQVYLVCGKTDMRQGIDSRLPCQKSIQSGSLLRSGLSLLRRSKKTGSRLFIGMDRDFGYCINVLKMGN